MTTLLNFPLKNQLTDKAGPLDADGIPDNPRFNCVPEVFAAAIQYLTDKVVTGEELKDAEYGDKYVGGTALRKYVDDATDRARKFYGITAEPFNANTTVALIHQARAWLRQGYPVICTIPSQWGTAHPQAALNDPNFSTHCVVFYTENGVAMGAMNPWGGFEQAEPDEWWAGRLCYGQVWKIYKETPVATAPKPAPAPTPVTATAQQQPYDKVFQDAINAEKERDALKVQLAQAQAQIVRLNAALAAAANILHPYADVLNQILAAQK